MKEHFQDYGIRKWAGNDLIELQSEPLEALQKLVEPYAPCILQGCEVTENEGGNITVEPGLVALQGKDYKGEDCVKIARFAGIADEKPPVYLILDCEPDKRVYGDSKSKAIAYHYRAVATTQEPKKPYLKINASGNKRMVDTLGITQKLDREGGNASDVKVVFGEENTEELSSGNTLAKLFGSIKRWLSDIKKKLDGIENGANVNVKANWKEEDATNDSYIQNKPGNATKQNAGFMSAEDKTKLDGIAKGAAVNVQADWDITDTNSDAFIKHKPASLPANGGTAETISSVLPITKGGTGATTAKAAVNNLLSNAEYDTAIPTDDAYFIVSGDGNSTYYKKPLSKLWNWIKPKLHTVATSGNYNDLIEKPIIPTVDTTLSTTSTNPVQNMVVKKALDGKANSSHTHDYLPLAGGIITGNLTLKGGGNYGNKLNFGDGDYVYLHEPTDDHLEIYGKNSINLKTSAGISTLQVNGTAIKDAILGALPIATTSANGLMSKDDKSKLDACVKVRYMGFCTSSGTLTKLAGDLTVTVTKSTTVGIYYISNIGRDTNDRFLLIHAMDNSNYARYGMNKASGSSYAHFYRFSDDVPVDTNFMIMVIGI